MASARPGAWAPTPIWGLVEESLAESEFLWRRWETGLSTHSYDLDGVRFWCEDRLLGGLDGVRVGGEAAVTRLLLPALSAEDPSLATVAAYLLATDPGPQAFEALAHAMKAAEPERLACFRRAIELAHSDLLLARLERELEAGSAPLLATLVDARTFQRREPNGTVADALGSPEPGLQAAGARALRFGAQSTVGLAVRRLSSSHAAVAEAAMESGLILGAADAWGFCRDLAASQQPAARARLLVAMLGNERQHAGLVDALRLEATRREAVFALGFAGTPAAVDACVWALQDPALSQLAAEAVCTITGLDLAAQKLIVPEAGAEPTEPVPFEQEDLDADLVSTADELLPCPDVAGVTRWWSEHSRDFRPGVRYLRGRPVDLRGLFEGLRREPMRRREAIALELAVRTAGRFQVQTRAFTREQGRQMAAFDELVQSSLVMSALSRSFSPV